MSKARELASLGNAYSDGALSNRNLIINGAMQVWQRGTSFTTGFTADRWVVGWASSATKVSSSLAGFGSAIRIVTSAGDPTFKQEIENYDGYLAGQTMTLSFWMKTDIAEPFAAGQFCEWYDGSNTYSFFGVDVPVVIETRGDWKRYARTFTLPSNATGYKFNARLDFNEVTSQTVDITGVQLEVGDTATPFEHRSYGQELALCQRFFERFYYPSGQNRPVALGHWYATNGVHAPFYYSEKRAAPTASVSNANHFGLYIGTSLDANYATTLNLVQLTSRCLNFNPSAIATGAVGTVNAAALISKMALYDAWIDIDAEL